VFNENKKGTGLLLVFLLKAKPYSLSMVYVFFYHEPSDSCIMLILFPLSFTAPCILFKCVVVASIVCGRLSLLNPCPCPDFYGALKFIVICETTDPDLFLGPFGLHSRVVSGVGGTTELICPYWVRY